MRERRTARATAFPRRLLMLVCLLAGTAAAGGCADAPTGLNAMERSALRTELDRNRSRWQALAIPDYGYRFRRVCDCPQTATTPVEIEVRDGQVYRVRRLSTGEEVAVGSAFWPTIDDLFEEIALALREGAASIAARYDPVYGYPLEISVRWSASDSRTLEYFASELTTPQ